MVDVANAFRILQVPSERRAALDGVVQNLNAYEWRSLSQILASRTFQFDIIGSLSLELVISVFGWLHWTDTFLYRRVSRRWCALLGSFSMTRISLSRWAPEIDLTATGEVPRAHSQRISAFRNGKPFAYATYATKIDFSNPITANRSLRMAALQNEFLAWIEDERSSNCIKILNLRKGQLSTFRAPGRQIFHGITLSRTLVISITFTSICYVLSLDTKEQKSFRLPSALIQDLTARDSMVAVLVSGQRRSVVCYDFTTGTTWSFELGNPDSVHASAALLLQPERRSVVVFSANNRASVGGPVSDRLRIVSSRYSYSGEMLSWNALSPSKRTPRGGSLHRDTAICIKIGDVQQVDHKGNYHIWPNLLSSTKRLINPTKWIDRFDSVIYNEEKDKLLVLDSTGCIIPDATYVFALNSHFKDTDYSWDIASERIVVARLAEFGRLGHAQRLTYLNVAQLSGDHPHTDYSNIERTTPLINEHYLVVFRRLWLHIWCFDENAPLPSGSNALQGGPRLV